MKKYKRKGCGAFMVFSSGEDGMPVGWTQPDKKVDIFIKSHVFAEQCKVPNVNLTTLDGEMEYDNPDRNGWIVYNGDEEPNAFDVWFVANEEFEKLYE